MVVCTYYTSYLAGINSRIVALGQSQVKSHDTVQKITKENRIGDIVQVVEHLASKCEVLSSMPNSPTQKNIDKIKLNSLSLSLSTHTHTHTHTL
jgi:MinD-like ATPase involved in chromosome partitioning or flagellar assembly